MPQPTCPDCRWLETRVGFDDGLNFECRRGHLPPDAALLGRTPCKDFVLADEAAPPARGRAAAARGAVRRTGPFLRAPDADASQAHGRKTPLPGPKIMDEHRAVKRFVADGDCVGFELYGTSRRPLSIVREMIRQRRRRLRVLGQGLMEADLLLAAGLAAAVDLADAGAGSCGLSPVLRRAVEAGGTAVREWPNGALARRLQAAAMGLPFLPTRSLPGLDTLRSCGIATMRDPYSGGQVALLPALHPDCAVIHVHRADVNGNCQIDGATGFAAELARAAKRVIVTAEEIVGEEVIRRAPERTVIPFYQVDAVVHAPFGAHPGETCGLYRSDEAALGDWRSAADDAAGAKAFLDAWVSGVRDHAAYRRKVGPDRLAGLRT